jgi:hypothetical protein
MWDQKEIPKGGMKTKIHEEIFRSEGFGRGILEGRERGTCPGSFLVGV